MNYKRLSLLIGAVATFAGLSWLNMVSVVPFLNNGKEYHLMIDAIGAVGLTVCELGLACLLYAGVVDGLPAIWEWLHTEEK